MTTLGFDNSNPSSRPSDDTLTSTLSGRIVSTPLGFASCTMYPSLLEFRRFQDHGISIARIFILGTPTDWIVSVVWESSHFASSQCGLSLNTISQWIGCGQAILDEVSKTGISSTGDGPNPSLNPDFPNLAALVEVVAKPPEVSNLSKDDSVEKPIVDYDDSDNQLFFQFHKISLS